MKFERFEKLVTLSVAVVGSVITFATYQHTVTHDKEQKEEQAREALRASTKSMPTALPNVSNKPEEKAPEKQPEKVPEKPVEKEPENPVDQSQQPPAQSSAETPKEIPKKEPKPFTFWGFFPAGQRRTAPPGIMFQVRGCSIDKTLLTCVMTATSPHYDRDLSFDMFRTTITDAEGDVFRV